MFALDRHTTGLADFVASEEDHAPCCFCVSFKHIGAHPRALRLILSGNTKTCDEYNGQCETFHEPPCFWVSAERYPSFKKNHVTDPVLKVWTACLMRRQPKIIKYPRSVLIRRWPLCHPAF